MSKHCRQFYNDQWLDIFDNVFLFNFNVAQAGHNRILVVSQSARFFCDMDNAPPLDMKGCTISATLQIGRYTISYYLRRRASVISPFFTLVNIFGIFMDKVQCNILGKYQCDIGFQLFRFHKFLVDTYFDLPLRCVRITGTGIWTPLPRPSVLIFSTM